ANVVVVTHYGNVLERYDPAIGVGRLFPRLNRLIHAGNLDLEEVVRRKNALLVLALLEEGRQQVTISDDIPHVRQTIDGFENVGYAETNVLPLAVGVNQDHGTFAASREENFQGWLGFLLAIDDTVAFDVVALVVLRLVFADNLVVRQADAHLGRFPDVLVLIIRMVRISGFMIVHAGEVQFQGFDFLQRTVFLCAFDLAGRKRERLGQVFGDENLAETVSASRFCFRAVGRAIAHFLSELILEIGGMYAGVLCLGDLFLVFQVGTKLERVEVLTHFLVVRVEGLIQVLQYDFDLRGDPGGRDLAVNDDVLVATFLQLTCPEQAVGVGKGCEDLFPRPVLFFATVVEGLAVRWDAAHQRSEHYEQGDY